MVGGEDRRARLPWGVQDSSTSRLTPEKRNTTNDFQLKKEKHKTYLVNQRRKKRSHVH